MLPSPANDNAPSPSTHRTTYSGDNEWYTPARYIELARTVLGTIDIDPASNPIAQKTVQAGAYYTAETNGLDKEWNGKVWMNPPYSRELIGRFIDKIVHEYMAGRTTEAIVLTNNNTDTRWATALFENASSLCFSPTKGCPSTLPQGQLFSYFGNNPGKSRMYFVRLGTSSFQLTTIR